eukprot:TRINITY_DN1768_c0_g1_i1.p1 TRINITY_DN1768_c0_g1~~TRINITY_DN1768_c0_g1_i1.p1  ORF type:complete len:266 (-),score=44.91 TRINITY_DN1768_c0_g1_i1:319-1116(-)
MGAGLSRALRPCDGLDVASLQSDSDCEWRTPTPPPAEETVIIFDWDDTLLCSSAIAQHRGAPELMEDLERAVKSILKSSMCLGETLIITNGNSSWVQESSRRFLPGIASFIGTVPSISARSRYEESFPGDPFMWKRQAFRDVLSARPRCTTNLVVLGDQRPEIEAARFYASQCSGAAPLVKTVKFKEVPSVAELLGQLSKASQCLCNIVRDDQSAHRGLTRRLTSPGLYDDDVMTCASSWRMFKTANDIELRQGRALPLLWPILN